MNITLEVCEMISRYTQMSNQGVYGAINTFCPILMAYPQYATMIILAGIIFVVILVAINKKKVKTIQAKLLDIKTITHDTKLFTFALPKGMNRLGLNIGEHLQLQATINGKVVQRKYTPVSRTDKIRDTFQLLIKIYYKTQQFPNGGEMTQYIDNLKIGQKIKATFPYGRFNYTGNSNIKVRQLNGKIKQSKIEHIYMVGGGTGITPLYQIIQYITQAENLNNRPNLTLLFANRTQEDILLKGQLQAYQNQNPKFKCYFSIDKSIKDGWTGFTGYVNDQKITKTLENINREKAFFVVCGPPILCNIVEKILVSNLKIDQSKFYRF